MANLDFIVYEFNNESKKLPLFLAAQDEASARTYLEQMNLLDFVDYAHRKEVDAAHMFRYNEVGWLTTQEIEFTSLEFAIGLHSAKLLNAKDMSPYIVEYYSRSGFFNYYDSLMETVSTKSGGKTLRT